MKPRLIFSTFILITFLFALALPVFAGGWAVATLDDLPTQVIAGQPLALGFMIRQHGRTPLVGVEPRVIARQRDTGERFTASAHAEGEPGHYAVTLSFPSAGQWDWVINDGFSTEDAFNLDGLPMPSLQVLDSVLGTSAAPQPARASFPIVVGGLGLVATLGGLLALVRTRSAWAAAFLLTAALASALGFVSANLQTAKAAPALAPLAEQGRDLFIAKGCVMCHEHEAVNNLRHNLSGFIVGPVLTNTSLTPDYLTKWLFKPNALKPNTEMPTLGLKEAEIEALVAFLTAK